MAITKNELLEKSEQIRARFGQRNGEYALARRRYAGELWDPETNPEAAGRYSLAPNYIKPITDKNVQLLVGQLPAIQVLPPGTDQSAREQAEKIESLLYRAWALNQAGKTFFKVALDSFMLRRGIIYYKWDEKINEVCFKAITPDDFYPEYDGEDIYSAIYVQKRLTSALKREYPKR